MGEIISAVLGLAGSGVGAMAGIVVSSKLTNWRLEQIEERLQTLDEHTKTIIKLEGRISELEHEVRDLKGA